MTSPIDNARRHLALAQLLLSCSAPTSIEEAVSHAEEALKAVRELQAAAMRRAGASKLALRRAAGGEW